MLKNENNIAVLEDDKSKRFYRLEYHSQALSKIPNSYIMTIFDCCREYMPPPVKQTLGLGGNDSDYKPDEQKYMHSH